MNRRKIGSKFEKEAFELLKLKFEKVEWLSKEHKSIFDFKCINQGKVFYGDSKFLSNGKPFLTYSQRKADFIITKVKGKIYFYWKNEFKDKVGISKPLDENQTTIQIYREDLYTLSNMCKKNENFRDKLHEIIQEKKK